MNHIAFEVSFAESSGEGARRLFISGARVGRMRNISFLFREKRSWKIVEANFIDVAVDEEAERKETRSSLLGSGQKLN